MCANAYDAGNWDASVYQAGVGYVGANAYEFTFFGQTQRGHGVLVMTDGAGPAGFNMVQVGDSCFGATGPACAYQDVYLMAFTPAGFTYAGAYSGGGSMAVCYSVGDLFGCVPQA